MATVKISELESATSVTSSDVLPIVQNGQTKKVTADTLVKGTTNIITASFNGNFTKTKDDYETLPLNASNRLGNKLSLTTDNGIKIVSDINYIKISSKVSFNNLTAGLKWLTIFKNDEAVSANPHNLSNRGMVYATDTLIPVVKNDVIYLKANGTTGDVIRGGIAYTNLTVEVIE